MVLCEGQGLRTGFDRSVTRVMSTQKGRCGGGGKNPIVRDSVSFMKGSIENNYFSEGLWFVTKWPIQIYNEHPGVSIRSLFSSVLKRVCIFMRNSCTCMNIKGKYVENTLFSEYSCFWWIRWFFPHFSNFYFLYLFIPILHGWYSPWCAVLIEKVYRYKWICNPPYSDGSMFTV